MEKKQLTIYEITRTAIAKDGLERTSTTYHLIEEHAKIAEERDILKSKLDIKHGEYDEDFDDWIQALIKEEEIELIIEER